MTTETREKQSEVHCSARHPFHPLCHFYLPSLDEEERNHGCRVKKRLEQRDGLRGGGPRMSVSTAK